MPYRYALWILILVTQLCFGQHNSSSLHFDHLSIDNGLSHNTVFSLLQDKHGYIWIGTQNGLNKYDGYTFQTYPSSEDLEDANGFKGKHISALFEDSKQNIWVGTKTKGINFKSKLSDRFINLISDSAFATYDISEVSSFYEDKDANIWITTIGSGILKYNPDTKQVSSFNTQNSNLSVDVVFDLVEDSQGVMWIGTLGEGLNYLEKGSSVIKQLNLPNSGNLNGFRKKLILEDEVLWVGSQGTGVYKIKLSDKSYVRYSKMDQDRHITADAVVDLLKTDDGLLFIATSNHGLNVLDTKTDEIFYYEYQAKNPNALNSNSLLCMLEDRSGNIWIGSFNGGLNIYKPKKTWFSFYKPPVTKNLPSHSVLSVLETKNGEILVGTDGAGISWLKDGELSQTLYHNPTDPNSMSANEVKSIYQDSRGQIWLGFFAGGLDLYEPTFKSFRHVIGGEVNVWSIAERDNKLIVGTLGDGIFTVDLETKKVEDFKMSASSLNSSTGLNVSTVMVDKQNRLWIGSLNKGIDLVDGNNSKHFYHEPSDSLSLSTNEIRSIFQDSDGNIWIGTEGGGLNKWMGNNQFSHIGTHQGLIANDVLGITEDDNDHLWITTFEGLSRIHKSGGKVLNFDFRTSQITNQFNQEAIMKGSKGNLYFGGVNGLHTIHPDNVLENNTSSELIFTNLKIYGSSVQVGESEDRRIILEKPIELSEDIWLTHVDKSFTIYFSSIDFTPSEENQILYKMEGFNDDWLQAAVGKPKATYTNLDPGLYTFKIKNKEKTTSIRIHIEPPYYKTIWFRILLTLVICTLVFMGLRFWLKRRDAVANRKILQLKNENLAAEISAKNSKLMFSSAQMAHKNEILTELKENLIEFEKKPEGNFRSLIRKLDHQLKNEDYWKEFNIYFNEVDQNFLDKITKRHPKLTKNDLRLCSLLRMNLSTKEIASLLNISVRAVEQGRYRLKKRFDLGKLDDLSKYIASFNSKEDKPSKNGLKRSILMRIYDLFTKMS